jgi:Tol biopolymer transport system component
MNADGTGLRQLTRNSALDSSPAGQPDGRMLAFTVRPRRRRDERCTG